MSAAPAVPTLPSYHEGYRTVLSKRQTFAEVRTAFTFTFDPAKTGWAIWLDCAHHDEGDATTSVELRVNKVHLAQHSCNRNGKLTLASRTDVAPSQLERAGLATGVPMSLSFQISHSGDPGRGRLPQEGWIAIVLGEAVPYEDYVFPARPASLRPLPTPDHLLPGDHLFQPSEPTSAEFVYGPKGISIVVICQTPGRLTLRVAGYPLWTAACFDYSQELHTFTIAVNPQAAVPGSTVMATVEATGFTGEWVILARTY